MSLAARSFSAGRWTIASNVVRAASQVIQLIVLTRFLSPQDYGMMALVTVVIGYAALFNDMGLSTAFVQRQHITHEERSSLYWLSVATGVGLMLLVMGLSPFIAQFFREPELAVLLCLVSTNFLVVALAQQLRADAEKSLNFRPLAMIEIASAIIGLFVAVIAAWLGLGVYALVASAMLSAWLTTCLSWHILAKGWRPLWRLQWAEVRWFARFGGIMVANNAVNHVNATLDIVLGGRLIGSEQLGIYSVPRNLILQVQSVVNPVFTRVGFPVIASIQHDRARVQLVYSRIMNLTAAVNAPIYVAVAIFSPEFVQIFLGEAFHDSAQLLRILAAWGLLRSFGNPVGSLLFGLGRVGLATWWNVGLLFVVPPTLWLGSQFDTIGMAWSMVIIMALLFVPGWALLVLPTSGLRFWAYSSQVLRPTLCALLAGIVCWTVVIHIESPTSRLAVGIVTGATAYVVLSLVLNLPTINLVKEMIKRKRQNLL